MELEVKDAKLHFEFSGDPKDPSLVLWNGAGCSLRMWDRVVEKLKNQFFTITFDVRGTGLSEVKANDKSQFTFETYSEDLNKILEYLNVSNIHIWSMAWGSRAALAYSALFPEKVLSATLSDASIGIADTDSQKEGSKRAYKKQIASGVESFDLPEGWNQHLNNETMVMALSAAKGYNFEGAVKNINCPVLIMTGDHDPNLKYSNYLEGEISESRLVVLTDVGHGSVLQRPDLTLKEFLSFHKEKANIN